MILFTNLRVGLSCTFGVEDAILPPCAHVNVTWKYTTNAKILVVSMSPNKDLPAEL